MSKKKKTIGSEQNRTIHKLRTLIRVAKSIDLQSDHAVKNVKAEAGFKDLAFQNVRTYTLIPINKEIKKYLHKKVNSKIAKFKEYRNETSHLTLIRLGFLKGVFSGGVNLTPPSSYFKKNLFNINITLYNC